MVLSDRQRQIVELLLACDYQDDECDPCSYCNRLIHEFASLAKENDE
jgi:cytidine deaminase